MIANQYNKCKNKITFSLKIMILYLTEDMSLNKNIYHIIDKKHIFKEYIKA